MLCGGWDYEHGKNCHGARIESFLDGLTLRRVTAYIADEEFQRIPRYGIAPVGSAGRTNPVRFIENGIV